MDMNGLRKYFRYSTRLRLGTLLILFSLPILLILLILPILPIPSEGGGPFVPRMGASTRRASAWASAASWDSP